MKVLKYIFSYLNPIAHLGDKQYTVWFPLLTSVMIYILSELFGYFLLKKPNSMGTPDIIITFIFLLYFSFRFAIKGGIVTWIISTLFFTYFIISRQATIAQKENAVIIAVTLAIVYAFIALIVGWLKQTIDDLIDKEADARRRLEAIIEQLPVGIIISDKTGKVMQVNKRLHDIIGTAVDKGFIVGKDNPIVVRRNNVLVSASESPLAQAITKGKPVIGKEFVVKVDDKRKFIQVSATSINNKKNNVIAGVSIVTNITEQKELEERKDDFINIASHELKTPLTSAKIFSQVLQKRLNTHKDIQVVDIANKLNIQLIKLEELVRNLLDITKMKKGKLPIIKKKISIKDLVEEVVEEIKLISPQEIFLNWKARDVVYVDKDRIRQVLTNLLTNAVKYSPEDKEVVISARTNKKNVEISVRDFGIGIPKQEHKKIFSKFYQASGRDTFPGLGLGLYISSEIIKQHGGKMWVESETGKGSTFYFTLPLIKSEDLL